jgi:hypothetical protein
LLENKVELIFYNERPFEEILKEVASLPPHSAIFFQTLAVDGAGAVYGDKEPLKRIYEVANAPIFTFDETHFNGEVVGGPMFSPAEGARPMAAAAVANGIDAMKENRIVSIRTSRVEKFAELSVSDLGPGIPEDKLKEVFEPFFTSKAEGMGMGLSIARTIVEAHDGQIWAENRDHGGATFRIRLPISNNGAGPS